MNLTRDSRVHISKSQSVITFKESIAPRYKPKYRSISKHDLFHATFYGDILYVIFLNFKNYFLKKKKGKSIPQQLYFPLFLMLIM